MKKSGPDTRSFGIVAIEKHSDDMLRYIARRLRNRQDIDDLAQDVYENLLRNKYSEAEVDEPLKLIYHIAKCALYDHRQEYEARNSHTVEVTEAERDIASEALPDRLEEHLDLQQQLQQVLDVLPDTQREVLLLLKSEGLSRKEVATRLNLSLDTVKKYITVALNKLRTDSE